jgi:hypothetical protein
MGKFQLMLFLLLEHLNSDGISVLAVAMTMVMPMTMIFSNKKKRKLMFWNLELFRLLFNKRRICRSSFDPYRVIR